jgi:hypothetical protein
MRGDYHKLNRVDIYGIEKYFKKVDYACQREEISIESILHHLRLQGINLLTWGYFGHIHWFVK